MKNLTISLFLFFISLSIFGQTLWEKQLPFNGRAHLVTATRDSGYLVIMTTLNDEVYALKYDQSGDTVWTRKVYYGCHCPWVNKNELFQINDSTFLLSLYSSCGGILLSFTRYNLLWVRTERYNFAQPFSIMDSLIYCGCNKKHFWNYCQINNNGELMEEYHWVEGALFPVDSLIYIYHADVFGIFYNYCDFEVFDTKFNLITYKEYHDFKGFLFARTNSGNIGVYDQSDNYFFLVNAQLDSITEHTDSYNLVSPQAENIMISTPDTGYLLNAEGQSPPFLLRFIIKLDSLGWMQWYHFYDFAQGCHINDIINATDGPGYVLLVYSEDYDENWLIRVDENGIPLGKDERLFEQLVSNDILIFPNPAQDYTNITFKQESTGILRIMNLTGSIVRTDNINKSISAYIETGSLPAGIYLIIFQDSANNRSLQTKLVKQ
jgi:hypothetical protein